MTNLYIAAFPCSICGIIAFISVYMYMGSSLFRKHETDFTTGQKLRV